MAVNKATDFICPPSVTSYGSNVSVPISFLPYLETNRNTLYYAWQNDPLLQASPTVVNYIKKVTGTITKNLTIPAAHFKTNNAYVTLEVNTCDKNNKFVSGSFGHTMLLYHPNYKNYLSNFTHPRRTYPGETCTIEILPPKDEYPGGVTYTVDLMYHQSVGRDVVGTNLSAGKFSFVVPELAINSSMDIRVKTISKRTGQVQGQISQGIKIEQASTSSTTTTKTVDKPTIIFPENYSLTLSEGEIIKIKGSSEYLDDYKIIYAKQPCNVANAVSKYTSANTYFDASKTDLKNELIKNASGNANYFVLKDFDQKSTFITQDPHDKKMFHIRTPGTNDYESINDFYVLQWFKDVEPGDLVYVYAIQRGTQYTTVTNTTPSLSEASIVDANYWRCKHCNLNNYAWWSKRNNWNPYCKVDLNTIKTFMNCRKTGYEFTAYFTIGMSHNIQHPPVIWVTTSSSQHASQSSGTTLTAVEYAGFETRDFRFSYHVPMSFIKNAINNGYRYIYFHTHWGANPEESVQYKERGKLTVAGFKRGISTSNTTSSICYSDNNYNSINKIPLSTMSPYVVVPPAVRPLELAIKDRTKSNITISYANPLYGQNTESIATYTELGDVFFDVSMGDDINDLSKLNAIKDENNNDVQVDETLDMNIGEKRLLTYEKTISMPSSLLTSIRNVNSNDIYLDLKLKSIDNGLLNFKSITSNGIKIQIMFSKSGENRTRAIDFDGSVIDYKKSEYTLYKAKVSKDIFINNNFDTIHLLYNTDKYSDGKAFPIEDATMQLENEQVMNGIGWRKIDTIKNYYGSCSFVSNTFEIAKYALNYDKHKLRLCLENMNADKPLFAPPVITVHHRNIAGPEEEAITQTVLTPVEQGEIGIGSDIHYEIPYELYNVNIDDVLTYVITPQNPYPIDMPEITFSNAFIEVIGLYEIDQIVDKYTTGFTAAATFFKEIKNNTNSSSNVSTFDPVECVDVIMCCFDSNKQLINKAINKRRDIYNGKKFIYYTDRRWHNFVNDKYINNIKYKSNYDMTFSVPDNTEYLFFIAFTYSNWHGNPSIYSMSNILTVNSVKQDFSLEFIDPSPLIDELDGSLYANSDINNPPITVKINAQRSSNVSITDNAADNSFDLAKDPFDRDKWIANPIIYSNTKTYGYEQPIFNSSESYVSNNAVNTLEPLYNDIEYYYHWKNLYGKEKVLSIHHVDNTDLIEIDSRYTVFEDEGDKFISNRAVPYIEIPAELYSYDRSKITLFLDTDFGMDVVIPEPEKTTKLISETFTIDYKISKVRGALWGVSHLWNQGLMKKLGDVSAIEDIKIEWGMKLNLDHRHPTQGRKGPILVEDFWAAASHYYGYNPCTLYAFLKDKNIRDYGGNNIWHKNYGDYIYFEITNPRLKQLFLDSNCHWRRHDAIIFEDYKYDWCWEPTVKVRFTVTKRVYEDGTPIVENYLPEENFTSNYNIPGWNMFEKPKFIVRNIRLTKAPTSSDPSFVLKYDVMLSPLIYKHDNAKGDAYGNIFKYSWGHNAECYRKWETVTVRGSAPYTHEQTHYFITYNKDFNVVTTFRFKINKDGTVIQL